MTQPDWPWAVCGAGNHLSLSLFHFLTHTHTHTGKSSVWKDVVVALSVSLCVVGVVHALRQRRVTQKRIDKFLESFREKERELRTLQERCVCLCVW